MIRRHSDDDRAPVLKGIGRPVWQKVLFGPRKFPCVDELPILRRLLLARLAPLSNSFLDRGVSLNRIVEFGFDAMTARTASELKADERCHQEDRPHRGGKCTETMGDFANAA